MGGGGWLTPRNTIFFYLAIIVWGAKYTFENRWRTISWIGAIAIPISLLIVRFPAQKEIGDLAKEYIEVTQQLPHNVTVLPLSFSNQGQIDNKLLCPRIEIFKHLNGYVGASKQLILFDNYEANTSVSPLLWKESKNPYYNLSKDGIGGMEMSQPRVNIMEYNKIEGCRIDYVLIWGDDKRFGESKELKQLFTEINIEYDLVYTSVDGLSLLYKKK